VSGWWRGACWFSTDPSGFLTTQPKSGIREGLDDEGTREDVLYVARELEQEPTAIGISAHLLAVARR